MAPKSLKPDAFTANAILRMGPFERKELAEALKPILGLDLPDEVNTVEYVDGKTSEQAIEFHREFRALSNTIEVFKDETNGHIDSLWKELEDVKEQVQEAQEAQSSDRARLLRLREDFATWRSESSRKKPGRKPLAKHLVIMARKPVREMTAEEKSLRHVLKTRAEEVVFDITGIQYPTTLTSFPESGTHFDDELQREVHRPDFSIDVNKGHNVLLGLEKIVPTIIQDIARSTDPRVMAVHENMTRDDATEVWYLVFRAIRASIIRNLPENEHTISARRLSAQNQSHKDSKATQMLKAADDYDVLYGMDPRPYLAPDLMSDVEAQTEPLERDIDPILLPLGTATQRYLRIIRPQWRSAKYQSLLDDLTDIYQLRHSNGSGLRREVSEEKHSRLPRRTKLYPWMVSKKFIKGQRAAGCGLRLAACMHTQNPSSFEPELFEDVESGDESGSEVEAEAGAEADTEDEL